MTTKTVCIPACEKHDGVYKLYVCLRWNCPVCGGPRGSVRRGWSYDGRRKLSVDIWDNPCGHIDKYTNVRKEAFENGLNIVVETIPARRGERI